MLNRISKSHIKYGIVLGLILILVSCSGKESIESSSGVENKTKTEAYDKNDSIVDTAKPQSVVTNPKLPPVSKDPLELVLYDRSIGMGYDFFMQRFGDFIKKKHSNLSFKYIRSSDVPLEQLAITNQRIDLYMTQLTTLDPMKEAGYTDFDITDLAKQFNVDLSRFEALDALRSFNGGVLNALPYLLMTHVLTYNIDLFDKFAEPYPWDGMTWEDTIDIARKLTKEDGGIQYIGFAYNQLASYMQFNPYGAEMWNPDTGKATINEGMWHDIFRTLTSFYAIPNLPYFATAGSIVEPWAKEKRIAMILNFNEQYSDFNTVITEELNVDVVRAPSFKDLPGVGSAAMPLFFGISATTPYKNEAFAALEVIVSEEVVRDGARKGRLPALRIDGFEEIYGLEAPAMQGINIKGLFPEKYGKPTGPFPEGVNLRTLVTNAFRSVAEGTKDINTALRDANEEADQLIKAALSK